MTNVTLNRMAHVTIRIAGEGEQADNTYYQSRSVGEKISLEGLQTNLDMVLSEISKMMVKDFKEGRLK